MKARKEINEGISLTLPQTLLIETDQCAKEQGKSRVEYVRRALEEANARHGIDARRIQMSVASLRARAESVRVAQEFS